MNGRKLKNGNRTAKEQAYLYVRDKIIKGEINGGEFIEEESISFSLGVSRTPVREAFLRLEAEKFIDLIPRKGAQVRQITGKEIINIYETRRLIEIHAASSICRESITVPDEMFSSHEAMKAGAPNIDYYQHIINDSRFHASMVEAIGNPVLVDVYKSIQDRKMRVAYTAISLTPDRIGIIIKQHQEIIDALLKQDADSVENVLKDHLWPIEEMISQLPK